MFRILWLFVCLMSFAIQADLQERNANTLTSLKRGKRYLDFTKGSRMSWRCNVKNNILNVTTIWGYGYGFRVNFPFPDKSERHHGIFKRDIFQALTDILNGHGLDGQACLLKSFCTALLDVNSDLSDGMLYQLLKYMFTLNDEDKRYFPYLRRENCQQILHSHCPLSFNNISPYTDDV